MTKASKELSLILDFFKDTIIGKNTKGIVHNLNGPIQVLSMNLELLLMDLRSAKSNLEDSASFAASEQITQALERLEQIDEIISKITGLVRLMGTRIMVGDGEDEESPIIITQILNEAVEFWKADLFFKHNVELDIDFPDTSPVIIAKEYAIRDLLDGIFFSSIELLKDKNDPILKVSLDTLQTENKLLFQINGSSYPVQEVENSYKLGKDSYAVLGKGLVVLGLLLANESAKEIPATISLDNDSISISFNSPS